MSIIRADSVSPSAGGTLKNLPRGVAGAWTAHDNAGVVSNSVNVSSVTDNGAGSWGTSFTSAFASAAYSAVPSGGYTYSGTMTVYAQAAKSAGSFTYLSVLSGSGTATDPTNFGPNNVIFGDLA